jgi:ankyrin repeat protein
MTYKAYKLFYKLLLIIALSLFIECGCANSEKPPIKPNRKKVGTNAPNNPPNQETSDKAQGADRKPGTNPSLKYLNKLSPGDLRVMENIYGGKATFLVNMLQQLKDDPTQVNMNSRDNTDDGATVLHAAVKYGVDEKSLIEDLVKLRADVNAQDDNGQTPLHDAINKRSINMVETLLAQGAAIDIPDSSGQTPLHMAAKDLSSKYIQALVDKASKEQINKLSGNGQTALHIAIIQGNLPAVKILLQQGAEFNIFTSGGKNALHLAAARGYFDIFKKLVKAGADINTKTQDNKSVRDITQDKDIIDYLGGTASSTTKVEDDLILPLIEKGTHPFLVDKLLNLESDINATDAANNHTTALQQAAEIGEPKLVKILLDHGAAINQQDNNGETALHKAARAGHQNIVEMLLAQGASIDIPTKNGHTALSQATMGGKLEVVKELVNCGADVNIKVTSSEYTPLYLAADRGNLELVEYLLTKHANVDVQNSVGITPLYIASSKGNVKVVNSLIARGADVNLAMIAGITPLGVAANKGYLAIVQALLQAGAKVQQRDIDNTSNEEIRQLLQAHMNSAS